MTESANQRMFRRLWFRALTVKRPQAALAAASLLVGAATISMLLNLYSDVQRKMTEEFSAYGANVVLAPSGAGASSLEATRPGQALFVQSDLMDDDVLRRLEPIRQQVKGLMVVPRLDAVARVERTDAEARLPGSVNVVAVGADFSDFRRLNPEWHIEALGHSPSGATCAVGTNLAARLSVRPGDRIKVQALASPTNEFLSAAQERVPTDLFSISSIVSSGSVEDDQVFLPLSVLQDLMGLAAGSGPLGRAAPGSLLSPEAESEGVPGARGIFPSPSVSPGKLSLVQLYVPGDGRRITSVVRLLREEFRGTGIDVRPVRRIVYSEGRVLGIIRGLVLWLTALILVIIALCVMATMTAIVLERRKDVAVMKALGASNRKVVLLFLAEGATLGLLAGAAGYIVGGLLASELGERLFGVSLRWSWWAWPVVCLATVLLALAATYFPVRAVRRVEPAVVLKGA